MLATAITLQEFAKGEDIIVEGDYGDKFFIILNGKVEVLKA